MTTASWSTVVDQSTDAGFRAWGSELSAKIALVGAVQTADTGQINWTTVTRAAVNTMAGYEIWRLSGSALFLKIEYGSAGATASPAFNFTVGTGSNGSGTLTGQLSTRTLCTLNGSPNSLVTAFQSYLCATASFFGLAWKVSAGVAATLGCPFIHFCTGLTVDGAGAPTSIGFYTLRGFADSTTGPRSAALQTVRTAAPAVTRGQGSSYCVIPGAPPTSSDGVNNQAYLHWLDTPAVQPALYTATILQGELNIGNTVSLTLVGSTPHTYICIENALSSTYVSHDSGNQGPKSALIMLWE